MPNLSFYIIASAFSFLKDLFLVSGGGMHTPVVTALGRLRLEDEA